MDTLIYVIRPTGAELHSSLERINTYPPLIFVTFHSVSMVLETDTVSILVNYLTSIVHSRIFVNDGGRWLQHIDEEHTEKETNQKRQQLQMIEEFHNPYSVKLF